MYCIKSNTRDGIYAINCAISPAQPVRPAI